MRIHARGRQSAEVARRQGPDVLVKNPFDDTTLVVDGYFLEYADAFFDLPYREMHRRVGRSWAGLLADGPDHALCLLAQRPRRLDGLRRFRPLLRQHPSG